MGEHFADALRDDAGGLIMEHAVLSVDTTLRCLEAPLTEVTRITLSDNASLEKAKAMVDKYVVYANREETLPIAAAFGQTVDLENVGEKKLIFVVGWKTAEVSYFLSDRRQDLLLTGLTVQGFQDQDISRNADEVKEYIKDMAAQVGGFESEARTISLGAILGEEAA